MSSGIAICVGFIKCGFFNPTPTVLDGPQGKTLEPTTSNT